MKKVTEGKPLRKKTPMHVKAQEVKVLLHKRGYRSVSDLARRGIGCSENGLLNVLANRRPNSRFIPKLALVLNVPLSRIVRKSACPEGKLAA